MLLATDHQDNHTATLVDVVFLDSVFAGFLEEN